VFGSSGTDLGSTFLEFAAQGGHPSAGLNGGFLGLFEVWQACLEVGDARGLIGEPLI
jgi:hypothetical protein